MVMLENMYPKMPENVQTALEQAYKFLNGGQTPEVEEDIARLYSFSKDANFIFSAFRQTHGIDLETENMHWWKFLALFMDLGEKTAFCNLVVLRERVKSGKATKEECQVANEIGDLFDVPEPDTRTPEEKMREVEFLAAVGGKS